MSRHTHHSSNIDPLVVEGARPPGVKGIAPGAGQEEPDPDWQPM